ncbi:unnamed protein product [Mycena citricolor]|uniref:Uncharacterized protein n=1 Tax=Mycena citricolor TaxID=2018698 RepID=A0AAD2GWQ2_9AGAR|nr:unnamed protein product [Mycena citricolor]
MRARPASPPPLCAKNLGRPLQRAILNNISTSLPRQTFQVLFLFATKARDKMRRQTPLS